MGWYHESEPTTDEESGLDVIPVQKYITDDHLDRTLQLLLEDEQIGKKRKQKIGQEAGVTDTEQRIFELYEEYRPKMLRYVHSMYLNREAAEELVQETFMRLTTELVEGRDIENLHGWITRVTHNLAVDFIKKKEKDAERLTDLSAVDHETLVDPAATPDETYRKKEQLRRLEISLLTLNPQQRQCFNLRTQGLHYKDIAKALGISEQRAAIVVKQVGIRLAALCA